MNNFDMLINAGVIPPDHSLSDSDIAVINKLTTDEVNALVSLQSSLGTDFIRRNVCDAPNCFL